MATKNKTSQSHNGLVEKLLSYHADILAILERFEEIDEPPKGDELGAWQCVQTLDSLRYFRAEDDTSDERLAKLAFVSCLTCDACELIQQIQDSPSAENAFELASTIGMIEELLNEVGVVTSKTWIDGESIHLGRSKGGKASKLLTLEQEQLAQEIIAEKLQGCGVSKSAACIRAAADLLKDHGIVVSPKTLSRLGQQ